MKNEKYALQDLDYGKKSHKQGKEKLTCQDFGIWRETLKKLKNEKQTLSDLEYSEKTKKLGKWDILTVEPRIW